MPSRGSSPASSISFQQYPSDYHRGDFDSHVLQPGLIQYDASELAPAPFENRARYYVVAMDLEKRKPSEPQPAYWVSVNALAPTMSASPHPEGPVGCSCDRPGDSPAYLRRFDQAQNEPSVWQPSWIRERSDPLYYEAFIPDLFSGEGPCALRSVKGLLTQWEPEWVTIRGARVEFTDAVTEGFNRIIEFDKEVESCLRQRASVPSPSLPAGADTVSELREWWTKAARDIAKRRGIFSAILIGAKRWGWFAANKPEFHAKLLEQGYYALGPLGVWVEDTMARLVTINEYVRLGVPVFFKWTMELVRIPSARALVPPMHLFPESPSTPPRRAPLALPAEVDSSPAPGASAAAAQDNTQPPEANLSSDEEYAGSAYEEVFSPGRTRNSARLRMPVDGEAVFVTEWVRIPFSNMYTSAPLMGQPDRVRGDIQLMRVRALANSPSPDVSSAAPTLAERLNNNVPPAVPRRKPAVIRRPPVLRVFDYGHVMSVLRAESDKDGARLTAADIVQLCLAHGMRFSTPVYVSNPQEETPLAQHVVPETFWLDGAVQSSRMTAAWEGNVRTLMERPHVTRAALQLGGVFARIAKQFLPADYEFPFGPTRPVVDYGVPLMYRVAHDDGFPLHDDYLSEEERLVFLGKIKEEGINVHTLWPKEEIMRGEGYQGVWTKGWETWFTQHLRELQSDRMQPRGVQKWKQALRSVAHKDNGQLRL
ncbi:hypothetical protein EXIGLDRAFT_769684 [Exidia glandulosa HHB12029]|uniref:Uncharacterized protein n=1 Tax=Exidia glandulosa HHB12029 TaxID=1314781 RepID=A0A165H9B7_EXIGL|nr:hypothetical protein EXIGLDRAFT_769684 [Exidia glandulosa HHB12029]